MRALVFLFFFFCDFLAGASTFTPADQFLEQMVSGERTMLGKVAKVYFSPGKAGDVPPLLQKLLIRLAAEGAEVDAALVTEVEFAELQNNSALDELGYERLDFTTPIRPSRSSGLVDLLGVPKGIAPLVINVARPIRSLSQQERHLFYETSLIHNSILLAGLSLANRISLVPSALLTLYFYQVFSNLKTVFEFKGQGAVVVRHKNALEIDVNPYFLALVNLAEELAVNGAVGATIPSEGGLSIEETLSSSFAFGLAKTSVDRYGAKMEKRIAKALREGNSELAQGLKKQQLFILRLFFNGLVPMVRTVAMLTQNTAAGPYCAAFKTGTIALAGCHALYEEVLRMARLRFTGRKFKGKCPQALLAIRDPLSKPLPPPKQIE